ncbi:MAG TPA: ankyrin repeat domain-containing protein [Fimbriimonas sp.]
MAALDASLYTSIESGDEAAAVRLLKDHPDLAGAWRRTDYGGWESPLHVASKRDRLTVAKALVEAGAVIYAANPADYPPVFYAKSPEMTDYLLDASAKTDEGLPPTYGIGIDIVLATREGMLDQVRRHLEKDPWAIMRRGCIGETVLHWPAHNDHVEIVRLLLDQGADIEADEIGLYGGKPAHWAAEHAPGSLRLLLEKGADPNARNLMRNDFAGYTPLHMAACQPNECIQCAELLLEAGADPALKDALGKTPYEVARDNGRTRMADFLASR